MVLLNPPFSCRGGAKRTVKVSDQIIACSQAMAFVLTAIQYLAPRGQIVTVLPSGTLRAQKDREAWEYLAARFSVRLVSTNGHRTFNGCFPKTVVIHIDRAAECRRSRSPFDVKPIRRSGVGHEVELMRGSLQMHALPNQRTVKPTRLIHSTSLRGGEVAGKAMTVRTSRSRVSGPAVLLPRVGQPAASKIAVVGNRTQFALSDCVIAIKCRRVSHARDVKAMLLSNWDHVAAAYGGTCAPYVTLPRVVMLLSYLGLTIRRPVKVNDLCARIRQCHGP